MVAGQAHAPRTGRHPGASPDRRVSVREGDGRRCRAVQHRGGAFASVRVALRYGAMRCSNLRTTQREVAPDQSPPASMSSAVFDPSWPPYGATPSRRSTFRLWVRNASLGRGWTISRDAGLAGDAGAHFRMTRIALSTDQHRACYRSDSSFHSPIGGCRP